MRMRKLKQKEEEDNEEEEENMRKGEEEEEEEREEGLGVSTAAQRRVTQTVWLRDTQLYSQQSHNSSQHTPAASQRASE